MRLRELGERRLIEYIVRRLGSMPGAVLPPGDDASDILAEERLTISTDMVSQSSDMPPGMTLRDLGYRAITSVVSDAAAKGGTPIAYLVSLGLPEEMEEEGFRELWRGIEEAVEMYGGEVVGGDTGKTREVIIDAVCISRNPNPVSRLGARPGDKLAVTGLFGAQAAGLHALLSGSKARSSREVVGRFLRPVARVLEGRVLAETGAASASMDSSDGLALTLHTLAELNNVGFRVDEPPIDPLAERYGGEVGLDPLDLALYGGEEYELVVTIRPEAVEEVVEEVEGRGGRIIIIGEATENPGEVYVVRDGERVRVEKRGWSHFSNNP